MARQDPDPQDRFTPLEARLYALLPFDYRVTTLLIFVFTFGSLILITSITQAPPPLIAMEGEDGSIVYEIHGSVWASFVLSLIMTAALGLAEGTRRLSRSEEDTLAASLKPDTPPDIARMRGVPNSWKPWYRAALIIGVIAGFGFNAFMVFGPANMPADRYLSSVGLWFTLFSPPLYALGFRAGVDLAREASELGRVVRDHLDVDLFHLERLQVYGRIGLRGAFSWMVMAAILMLFLASPSGGAVNTVMAAITIGLSALGGAIIFASAVNPVRRRVAEAKDAELDAVRERLRLARDRAMAGEATAAEEIAGLTAYESWVSARSDWPISAPITRRFALYILIPATAWIGSALVERLVGS